MTFAHYMEMLRIIQMIARHMQKTNSMTFSCTDDTVVIGTEILSAHTTTGV
jgi:hypothetical protein